MSVHLKWALNHPEIPAITRRLSPQGLSIIDFGLRSMQCVVEFVVDFRPIRRLRQINSQSQKKHWCLLLDTKNRSKQRKRICHNLSFVLSPGFSNSLKEKVFRIGANCSCEELEIRQKFSNKSQHYFCPANAASLRVVKWKSVAKPTAGGGNIPYLHWSRPLEIWCNWLFHKYVLLAESHNFWKGADCTRPNRNQM